MASTYDEYLYEKGYLDEKAWGLYQEHMHALEVEEAEKDRAIDEAFLAYEAEGFNEEAEVPASC